MVNSDDFIKRLETVLDYYGLNAATFADKIGVQRSSLSHLLSGRNKPSLDFVLKIIEEFPEVDLYWILLGKGNFPKQESASVKNTSPLPFAPAADFLPVEPKEFATNNFKIEQKKPATQSLIEEQVKQIVFIYTDGSFKILHQKE